MRFLCLLIGLVVCLVSATGNDESIPEWRRKSGPPSLHSWAQIVAPHSAPDQRPSLPSSSQQWSFPSQHVRDSTLKPDGRKQPLPEERYSYATRGRARARGSVSHQQRGPFDRNNRGSANDQVVQVSGSGVALDKPSQRHELPLWWLWKHHFFLHLCLQLRRPAPGGAPDVQRQVIRNLKNIQLAWKKVADQVDQMKKRNWHWSSHDQLVWADYLKHTAQRSEAPLIRLPVTSILREPITILVDDELRSVLQEELVEACREAKAFLGKLPESLEEARRHVQALIIGYENAIKDLDTGSGKDLTVKNDEHLRGAAPNIDHISSHIKGEADKIIAITDSAAPLSPEQIRSVLVSNTKITESLDTLCKLELHPDNIGGDGFVIISKISQTLQSLWLKLEQIEGDFDGHQPPERREMMMEHILDQQRRFVYLGNKVSGNHADWQALQKSMEKIAGVIHYAYKRQDPWSLLSVVRTTIKRAHALAWAIQPRTAKTSSPLPFTDLRERLEMFQQPVIRAKDVADSVGAPRVKEIPGLLEGVERLRNSVAVFLRMVVAIAPHYDRAQQQQLSSCLEIHSKHLASLAKQLDLSMQATYRFERNRYSLPQKLINNVDHLSSLFQAAEWAIRNHRTPLSKPPVAPTENAGFEIRTAKIDYAWDSLKHRLFTAGPSQPEAFDMLIRSLEAYAQEEMAECGLSYVIPAHERYDYRPLPHEQKLLRRAWLETLRQRCWFLFETLIDFHAVFEDATVSAQLLQKLRKIRAKLHEMQLSTLTATQNANGRGVGMDVFSQVLRRADKIINMFETAAGDNYGNSRGLRHVLPLFEEIKRSAESFSQSTQDMQALIGSNLKAKAKESLILENKTLYKLLQTVSNFKFFYREQPQLLFEHLAKAIHAICRQYVSAAQVSSPIVLRADKARYLMPRDDAWLVSNLRSERNGAFELRKLLVNRFSRFWGQRAERHFILLFGTVVPVLKWLDQPLVIAGLKGATDILARAIAVPHDAPPESVLTSSFGVGYVIRDLAAIVGEEKTASVNSDKIPELVEATKDLVNFAGRHINQFTERMDTWQGEIGPTKQDLDIELLLHLGTHLQALNWGFKALAAALDKKVSPIRDTTAIGEMLDKAAADYLAKSKELNDQAKKELYQLPELTQTKRNDQSQEENETKQTIQQMGEDSDEGSNRHISNSDPNDNENEDIDYDERFRSRLRLWEDDLVGADGQHNGAHALPVFAQPSGLSWADEVEEEEEKGNMIS